MHWSDAAIILSSRKYGESSAVVRVLAREHGVFAGVVRGANSKNNRGIIQSGNVVSSNWQARLSQQLGTFKIELLEAHAAHIMQDAGKLAALTSACTITELALPERHPYPKIFSALHEFLHTLTTRDNWQHTYVKYELSLLAESGFGLDLSECAATGVTSDLIYVSPKSGRAVCRDAGEPYKERMLPLPEFLLSSPNPKSRTPNLALKETLAGMQLTGYFLEHSLLAPHGKKLPAARMRLQIILQELNATEVTN
jgi:DNA repair protein RecO (recombination protein O)